GARAARRPGGLRGERARGGVRGERALWLEPAAGRLRDARRPRPRAARPRAEAGGRRAGRTCAHRGDAFERARGAGAARARAAGARAERLTMERRQLAEPLPAGPRGHRSIDPPTGRGTVLVVSAGTADLPVAEEAALSAELMGNRVERVYDVGVAGLHRLLERREQLWAAAVLIVVAGMEGALPSVVGGLVDRPVIAVPTSVGYGTSLGGLAALLGMLNTCAAGVVVVNIDNGFGAAAAATRINHP